MRTLCDITCRSYLKNLYDVCLYLTFVVDVEIDVVTLCRGEMTTPSVVTFVTFVEPTSPPPPRANTPEYITLVFLSGLSFYS